MNKDEMDERLKQLMLGTMRYIRKDSPYSNFFNKTGSITSLDLNNMIAEGLHDFKTKIMAEQSLYDNLNLDEKELRLIWNTMNRMESNMLDGWMKHDASLINICGKDSETRKRYAQETKEEIERIDNIKKEIEKLLGDNDGK